MDLLVGCPVYRRTWIIDQWFEYVGNAAAHAGFEPSYVFVGDAEEETIRYIKDWHFGDIHFVQQPPNQPYIRDGREWQYWNEERYAYMVELRNAMLTRVRELAPAYFLSLDSDILLNERALVGALEGLSRFDGIGTKVFMTEWDDECPNYAHLLAGNLHRQNQEGFFPVDVIMAAKLMTPKAYNVDYENDHRGEDIGWSVNCKQFGVRLGWDGRYPSKHVMDPARLYEVDRRLGW